MNNIIHENYTNGRQTFIIPLTFPDLSQATSLLPRIESGGDVWELRADLLSDSHEPPDQLNPPSLEYVQTQLQLLQKLSTLPILFTIRTASQGGKFPDTAAEEALALMLMAVETGVEYIDVEIEWPATLIEKMSNCKGASKLVASFHDWTGNTRWTSSTVQEKYRFADSFGDIIKLSILSTNIYDAHELALFVRDHQASNPKPLLAVGMGPHGQLSRITSPISLVTHKAIPFPSAPGQLSLAQVHQGLHLLGQLPKRDFYLVGNEEDCSMLAAMHNRGFEELGLPYTCHTVESLPKGQGEANYLILNPSTDLSLPQNCIAIESLDILKQQAYQQFALWTGRRAPEIAMGGSG